jgi:hypothetical protein
MSDKYLTATDLGSYYHLSCQLALWMSFHEGHVARKRSIQPSSRVKAIFERGNEWENSLVRRLDRENLILRVSNSSPVHLQIENDPRNHFYVIGSSFHKDGLFAKEFTARGNESVAFGTFKPDYIEIWKRLEKETKVIEWHVIDAKSSKSLKVLLNCG